MVLLDVKKITNTGLARIKRTGLFNKVLEFTNHLSNITDIERCYLFKHNINVLPKCECGKLAKFKNYNTGYDKTCGTLCWYVYQIKHTKRKETQILKYGSVENAEKLKAEKAKVTNIQKYGVSNVRSLTEIKLKIKKTKLDRYGDENYCNVDKIKATKLDRYGDENYCNPELISQRHHEKPDIVKEEIISKRKYTNIQKYGVSFAWNQPSRIEQRNRENKWGIFREDLSKWTRYRYMVWKFTNKNNLTNIEHFEKRGKTGDIGAYHLDHIISIRYGYINNIPPEIIGNFKNLRMLPWLENITKGSKVLNIDVNKIIEDIIYGNN